MMELREVELFGVGVHAVTMQEALDAVESFVMDDQGETKTSQAVFLNAAKVVEMGRNPALLEEIKNADLRLADGQSMVWASKFLGKPLPERVAGIDFMMNILKRGTRLGFRFYFLGATDEVLEKATENSRKACGGINVVGHHHGYFSEEEESVVAQEISNSEVDVLFVGFGSPKKELFIGRHLKAMNARFVMGVGGSFDILSGKTKRAPQFMRKIGLEWLYRFAQEPGRMWKRYLFGNPLFILKVLKSKVGLS